MPKLTKKQEEYRVILNNYSKNSCIKVVLDYGMEPVTTKVFSGAFHYSKLLKDGIPCYEDIMEYLGNPETMLESIMVPSYFYNYYKAKKLDIKEMEIYDRIAKETVLFVEISTEGDVLLTIVLNSNTFHLQHAFDQLDEALEHKDEIIAILNPVATTNT